MEDDTKPGWWKKKPIKKSGPEAAVSSFIDPTTKEQIFVVPKKGEAATHAVSRVAKKHGVTTEGEPE